MRPERPLVINWQSIRYDDLEEWHRRVLQSVGGGAAASWSLNNLGPRIIDRNFEPGFFVEHFIKDMGIALDEAKRMKLDLPGLTLAKRLYDELAAKGHGRDGTQVLFRHYQA